MVSSLIYNITFAINGLLGVYFLHRTIVSILVFIGNKGLGHYTPFAPIISELLPAAAFGTITIAAFYLKEYTNQVKVAIVVLIIPFFIALLLGILFSLFSITKTRWN